MKAKVYRTNAKVLPWVAVVPNPRPTGLPFQKFYLRTWSKAIEMALNSAAIPPVCFTRSFE